MPAKRDKRKKKTNAQIRQTHETYFTSTDNAYGRANHSFPVGNTWRIRMARERFCFSIRRVTRAHCFPFRVPSKNTIPFWNSLNIFVDPPGRQKHGATGVRGAFPFIRTFLKRVWHVFVVVVFTCATVETDDGPCRKLIPKRVFHWPVAALWVYVTWRVKIFYDMRFNKKNVLIW